MPGLGHHPAACRQPAQFAALAEDAELQVSRLVCGGPATEEFLDSLPVGVMHRQQEVGAGTLDRALGQAENLPQRCRETEGVEGRIPGPGTHRRRLERHPELLPLLVEDPHGAPELQLTGHLSSDRREGLDCQSRDLGEVIVDAERAERESIAVHQGSAGENRMPSSPVTSGLSENRGSWSTGTTSTSEPRIA